MRPSSDEAKAKSKAAFSRLETGQRLMDPEIDAFFDVLQVRLQRQCNQVFLASLSDFTGDLLRPAGICKAAIYWTRVLESQCNQLCHKACSIRWDVRQAPWCTFEQL